MALRNNYLGSFTHFSTLGEYLHKRKNGIPPGDPVVQKYREGTVSTSLLKLIKDSEIRGAEQHDGRRFVAFDHPWICNPPCWYSGLQLFTPERVCVRKLGGWGWTLFVTYTQRVASGISHA